MYVPTNGCHIGFVPVYYAVAIGNKKGVGNYVSSPTLR
jgi:hypothetical protein